MAGPSPRDIFAGSLQAMLEDLTFENVTVLEEAAQSIQGPAEKPKALTSSNGVQALAIVGAGAAAETNAGPEVMANQANAALVESEGHRNRKVPDVPEPKTTEVQASWFNNRVIVMAMVMIMVNVKLQDS